MQVRLVLYSHPGGCDAIAHPEGWHPSAGRRRGQDAVRAAAAGLVLMSGGTAGA